VGTIKENFALIIMYANELLVPFCPQVSPNSI